MRGERHGHAEAEVAQFETRHPIGTKARLALALMIYTTQRRSDIVLFGKQHISNGWFNFTQFKNRRHKPVKLAIPIHPILADIIEKSPCGDLTLLVTEFNKPFTSNGFGNWFRKRCNEAGLLHCSAHGLRKAAAARLADRGASEHQIMSMTGHTTSKEVTRHTKAARQILLAKAAVAIFDNDAIDD
nr:tyrosine-type recombinase/integrase [Ensifer sp. ENS09]